MNKKPEIPFLIFEVEHHLIIKERILNAIQEMGTFSFINKNQQISNSDWQLGREFNRPYVEYLGKVFNDVGEFVTNKFNYEQKVSVSNFWFQQYKSGDYHLWHKHENCLFSCSYYVNLSEDNPTTSFELFGEEFEVNVKEGSILIFPSFLNHCSKKNESENIKTVIAFNLT